MIAQETWVMIKHLKQQGLSIRAIARQLSLERDTVRRALRRDGLPKYTRTTPRASKLDPYKPYLEHRLAECPELTAVRLYQEIQAQGYPGRSSILRDFLRPLRQDHRRSVRDGATFEIVPAAQVPKMLPELRKISDAWLSDKATAEKHFSVGAFDPAYLGQFDFALVRRMGVLVAFANLWETQTKRELSVDLMRFGPDAPRSAMDFLFVELMLWGRQQGY